MNTDKFNLEKGYDEPIKYDWLIGEIELEILKNWNPNHLKSRNTIIRIEFTITPTNLQTAKRFRYDCSLGMESQLK